MLSLATGVPDLQTRRSPMDHPSSFADWMVRLKNSTNDTDQFRSYLYYGFQPLFDALLENKVPLIHRKTALQLLEAIMKFSRAFLSGYYTGQEKIDALDTLTSLGTLLDSSVPYCPKDRNIGLYDSDGRCTPHQIQTFLLDLLGLVEAQTLPRPDYVVGCACGSSELALSMSALFDIKVDFVRRSKRRCDAAPRAITEHQARIKRRITGKTVYVVEDFVCTGQSLYAVMGYVQKLGSSRVMGLCLCRNTAFYNMIDELKVLQQFGKEKWSYAFET